MDLLVAFQIPTLWGRQTVGPSLPLKALNIAYVILFLCTSAGLENGMRHAVH